MARRYYHRRSAQNRYNPGLERAKQHIEEARQLSTELGGTDKDVKQYFFSLKPAELEPILNEYGRKFTQAAGEYARQTLPQWRSGRRKMSGLVASRLFSLLPAYMPLPRKYDLVKSLWEAKCPHSQKTFYIGPNADAQEIRNVVRHHLLDVVQEYTIPVSIVKRFQWLAGEDIQLQQELYNYFLQLNREVVSLAADDRVPRLLTTMRVEGIVQRISQSIRVGNHHLVLVLDPVASGVSGGLRCGWRNCGCVPYWDRILTHPRMSLSRWDRGCLRGSYGYLCGA